MEYEGDGDTNCNWCSRYNYRGISKGTGRLGNMRTSGDYSNYIIIKIPQNTDKGPGNLKRFAITKTPVKDHQLTLVLKTLKGIIMIIMIIPQGNVQAIKIDNTTIR